MLWWLGLTAAQAVTWNQEEQAALAQGDIVIRHDDATGVLYAGLFIDAAPSTVLNAITDLPPRVGEVGPLRELDIYERNARRMGATWTAGGLGISMTWSVIYTWDPTTQECRYTLDKSRPGDVVDSSGIYRAQEAADRTRLEYESRHDTGTRLPTFIRHKLANDTTRAMLDGIRKRAEASASP